MPPFASPHSPARPYAPPVATVAIVYGAVGGALGGGLMLGILALAAGSVGRQPPAAPNALGAWFVRWLQTAAPQALDGFYADATLGGIGLALVVGALLGAVFGGWIERLPDDHPLAWGLLWGLGLWAAARWLVAPALDPLLLETFDTQSLLPEALASALGPTIAAWLAIRALLLALLAFGLWLGLWVHAGRLASLAAPARGGAMLPALPADPASAPPADGLAPAGAHAAASMQHADPP
jgi:hypothetical protein